MKLLAKLTTFLGWVAMAMAFGMMMLMTADVVGSKLFGRPIPGAAEITEELMVSIVVLGLAYAEFQRGHLRIDLIVSRLPKRWRQILQASAYYALAFLTAGVLAWRGLVLLRSYLRLKTSKQGIITFELWPSALVFFVGMAMFALVLLALAVREFRMRDRGG